MIASATARIPARDGRSSGSILKNMRRSLRCLLAGTFAIAVAIAYAAASENGPDVAAIRALISKYAAGVNAEPVDIKLLSEVWDDSPDASLINPESYEHGWEQIKRNFYQGTMETLFAERKLTIHDVNVHAYADSGWAEFHWHFVAKLRNGGSTVESNGMETQIYRKTSGNHWVLVHVHYSALSR
jgi:ketosteroid isomerase-like protein